MIERWDGLECSSCGERSVFTAGRVTQHPCRCGATMKPVIAIEDDDLSIPIGERPSTKWMMGGFPPPSPPGKRQAA